MKIPFAKPLLDESEAGAAAETIMSGWVTQGPRVQEFEERFAAYTGSLYAVAVSNCTTALHLSLIVAGIRPGDEVICPSMTFIATANAIGFAGARPVFAEVGRDYNMDIDHAATLINEKTRAIMLVHQIGLPADIDGYRELCDQHKIKLIEDAACAAGSVYKGVKIGSHSELVCFSFHPRKVITTGDGGMITTSSAEHAAKLKLLRQHGMSVSDTVRHRSARVIKEEYLFAGYNYRMTDIQAAVGIKQLEKLDELVRQRQILASIYNEGLKEIGCIDLPVTYAERSSNIQSYAIYLNKKAGVSRDDLMQQLLDRGISTRHGIMTIHREKAYREAYAHNSLPVTEHLSDNSLLLPLYVPMKREEIDYVIESIKNILS
jgi:perosamine synthetase